MQRTISMKLFKLLWQFIQLSDLLLQSDIMGTTVKASGCKSINFNSRLSSVFYISWEVRCHKNRFWLLVFLELFRILMVFCFWNDSGITCYHVSLIYLQHFVVGVTLSHVTHCSRVKRVLVKMEEQEEGEGDTLKWVERGKKEENSSLLLRSLQTCNGGLISKHVMYFTPTDGDRGGGGWKEARDGGRGMAGRRRSVYRLPSQQVSPSPLLHFIPQLPQTRTQVSPLLKNLTSPPLPTHTHTKCNPSTTSPHPPL